MSEKNKNPFAGFSLAAGIFAFLSLCFFFFPLAVTLGVGAVLFAVLAKRHGSHSAASVIGMILGAASVILGVLEFFYLMYLYDLIKAPENIAFFNQVIREVELQLQQLKGFNSPLPIR